MQSYANLEQELIWSSENGQSYDLIIFDELPATSVDKDIQSLPCKVESIDRFTVACNSNAPNFSSSFANAAYFNSNAALLPAPLPKLTTDSIQLPLINSGDTSRTSTSQISSIN